MKPGCIAITWAAVLSLAACRQSPPGVPATPEPELKHGHPVVHIPPVETRPFEEGYAAGFDFGKAHATPRSPLPGEEEAQRIAHEQSTGQPAPTDRWERGFAEGYADGVRNVVTGQK